MSSLTTGMVVEGNCTYPSNYTLEKLQAEMAPQYAEGRLGLKIMPIKTTTRHNIVLDEPDIFRGRQAWRGIGKPVEKATGSFNLMGRKCTFSPGAYGESEEIDEEFLTMASSEYCGGKPVDLTEAVGIIQNRLLHRRYALIESMIWNSLVHGWYRATNSQGQVVQEQQFNTSHVATGIPWSDHENATPMADLMCLFGFGEASSAEFDSTATIYINQVTANCLVKNRNLDDIGNIGRDCGGTIMNLGAINEYMKAGNLPQFQVYTKGWVDDNGSFQKFIPDGIGVVIGGWSGAMQEKVGNYYLTRRTLGCGTGSGAWTFIRDNCKYNEIPRKIEISDGHNGGPIIRYPKRVITLQTGCANDCGF